MEFPTEGRTFEDQAAENVYWQRRYEYIANRMDNVLRELKELRVQNEELRRELRGHHSGQLPRRPFRDPRTIPASDLPPPPLEEPPLADPAAGSSTTSPPSFPWVPL